MAWGHQTWDRHSWTHEHVFGAVMPENPALMRTIGERIREAAELQRIWDEEHKESEEFLGFFEIIDPLLQMEVAL